MTWVGRDLKRNLVKITTAVLPDLRNEPHADYHLSSSQEGCAFPPAHPRLVGNLHDLWSLSVHPSNGQLHSQHPELMEIKCEEVNSDEDCLTPEPSAAVSYQQGCPEEHEMERAFLERAQNDSPISRVEIPIESSVSPSGRDSLLHSSVGLLPRFPEREGFVLVHK